MADLHFTDGDGGTVVVHGREADSLWALTDGFAAAKVSEGLAPVATTVLDRMPRTFSGKADRALLSSSP